MCCMLSVVGQCLITVVKSCGKCGLIVVNTILVLFGFGMILLATLYVKKLNEVEKFMNISHSANTCLTAGVLVLLIGCVGYVAVYTSSRIILMIFIACTGGVLLALIICFPLAQKSVNKVIENGSVEYLREQYQEAYINMDEKKIIAWHAAEAKFKCCGFDDPSDYSKMFQGLPFNYPPSCCGIEPKSFSDILLGAVCTDPNEEGCAEIIKKTARKMTPVVMVAYMFIILLEVWQLISLIIRLIHP